MAFRDDVDVIGLHVVGPLACVYATSELAKGLSIVAMSGSVCQPRLVAQQQFLGGVNVEDSLLSGEVVSG